MRDVPVRRITLDPYLKTLGEQRLAHLTSAAGRLRRAFDGRTVWNVNSTAAGGGVAELLHTTVPLARALGMDTRWLVIDGDEEFFAITKRLCTRLYGAAGDTGELGPAELAHYRACTAGNAARLTELIRPGDIVIVHESQPAGLVGPARELGATVVWRCHIGKDQPNEHTLEGQAFLRPFAEPANASVFLTARHVPDWAPRPHVIPPSIDPCTPKNTPLTAKEAAAVLGSVGILADGPELPITLPVPIGEDVTVRRPAVVIRDGPPPSASVPMVVQVSRWDRLKDMSGVLRAFAESGASDCCLTLAGADVTSVSDDPEAAEMFEECRRAWEELPPAHRSRVQLVCLPMDDMRENALVVNALQQHASVVVQKSLAEGFGLTATEAMWKSRPLLASAVGGLRDQVTDGVHGLLLEDPEDLDSAARHIRRLLTDRPFAERLGAQARRRVTEHFLPDRHLLDWVALIEELLTSEAI